MKYLLILLAMFGVSEAAEPTLYIAVDGNKESQRVSAFVEKSFADRIKPEYSKEVEWFIDELDRVRDQVLPHVVVVSLYDVELREKHRVPNVSCPSYRIGRYGVWKPFCKKTELHPTYCMRFLKFVIDDYTFEDRMAQWNQEVLDTQYATLIEYGDIFVYNLYEEYYYDYDSLLYQNRSDIRFGRDVPILPVIAYRPKPTVENPIGFELER